MEHINAISKGEGEVVEFSAVLETCPLNEVIIKCQFPKATVYFWIVSLFLYEVGMVIFPLPLTAGWPNATQRSIVAALCFPLSFGCTVLN